MPIEAQVALIVAKYAVFGLIPLVIPAPFPDVPLPLERIPIHWGTDLEYVRWLATSVGYTFHLITPTIGVNLAYWGPKIRVGVPQPAVNIDMDAETNLERISFKFDNRERKQPVMYAAVPGTTKFLTAAVGVRGGGLAFDGLYFVKGVRHAIRRGEYKQSFDLVRNGLVSTVPLVPA